MNPYNAGVGGPAWQAQRRHKKGAPVSLHKRIARAEQALGEMQFAILQLADAMRVVSAQLRMLSQPSGPEQVETAVMEVVGEWNKESSGDESGEADLDDQSEEAGSDAGVGDLGGFDEEVGGC